MAPRGHAYSDPDVIARHGEGSATPSSRADRGHGQEDEGRSGVTVPTAG
ncbi:hypothetical protein ACWIID_01480 [Streptomyces phaeochromogenes]